MTIIDNLYGRFTLAGFDCRIVSDTIPEPSSTVYGSTTQPLFSSMSSDSLGLLRYALYLA